jgi:hypothetical protein
MRTFDKRIVLVITWFGPLPFWLPAFLLSCSYNPGISWLIFSDSTPPPWIPANVKFLHLSIDTFNKRASEALKLKVCVSSTFAYKLCDLKIMYGRIFENELKGFDFWGCCDMDIVWGDICSFLKPKVLDEFDVITSRIGRISGHFCLFRNELKWNALYRRIPKISERVEDFSRCMRIDEDGLTDLLQGYKKSALRRIFTDRFKRLDLPRVFWDEIWTTSGKHQRQMISDPSLFMKWINGKSYGVDGGEMMYLHFHEIRKSMERIDFSSGETPREMVITTSGIFSLS